MNRKTCSCLAESMYSCNFYPNKRYLHHRVSQLNSACIDASKNTLTRVEGHLISIKDADELIAGDHCARRVELGADVVDVARLAVHLARRPLAAADVDHIRAQGVHPLALLGVLAIIAQVDGARAASGQSGIVRGHDGAAQDLQGLLVTGHTDAHVVGVARARVAGVCGVLSQVVVCHNRVQHQIEAVQDDSGSAQHLNAQNDAAVPEVGAQVQRLGDADL